MFPFICEKFIPLSGGEPNVLIVHASGRMACSMLLSSYATPCNDSFSTEKGEQGNNMGKTCEPLT